MWNFQKDPKVKKLTGAANTVSSSVDGKDSLKLTSKQQSFKLQKEQEAAKKAEEEAVKKKAKSQIRKKNYTSAEEFYRQVNEFKVANGYLLRMIEDGSPPWLP